MDVGPSYPLSPADSFVLGREKHAMGSRPLFPAFAFLFRPSFTEPTFALSAGQPESPPQIRPQGRQCPGPGTGEECRRTRSVAVSGGPPSSCHGRLRRSRQSTALPIGRLQQSRATITHSLLAGSLPDRGRGSDTGGVHRTGISRPNGHRLH